MYQIGDKVVYGIHGVCRVVDLEERLSDGKRLYYLALEPVGQGGSRFLVPTYNAAAMGKLHPMLSSEEMDMLWRVEAAAWIPDENRRKQMYRELICSGDRKKLVQMIRSLHQHKSRQSAAGRKVHLCDENFLRDAEKLLISEISVVMDMNADQAKQYIRNKIKEDA